MNWEVLSMKSKTSCYDPALAKSLLRRSWPMWLLFFLVLLALLPVGILRTDWAWGQERLDWYVLQCARDLATPLFVICVLVAMVQFHDLYFARSCGLLNSLPLSRAAVFWTLYLTGLLPMLLLEALTVLLTLLLTLGRTLSFLSLLQWFAVAAGVSVAGYGFASFCAMLTGNVLVLPLVYLVFNYLAIVLSSTINNLLHALLYGFSHFDPPLALYLSPIVCLDDMVTTMRPELFLRGLRFVLLYALAGLVFTLLARLLYQSRRMESAGDAVAIPRLKPVFVYCMSLGAGIVLSGMLLGDVIPLSEMSGRAAFLLTLLLVLLGAVLGWIAARMLLQKSFRVFRGGWKVWRGCALCCAVLALLCTALELDLTGYEKRVPELSEIRAVRLAGRRLEDPQNVAAAVGLHKSFIAHKADNDVGVRYYAAHAAEDAYIGQHVTVEYKLFDGSTLTRYYPLTSTRSQAENPGSDLSRFASLMNTPEAIGSVIPVLPVTAESISSASFDGHTEGTSWNYNLSTDQAVDFYETCLLPEIRAGIIGRFTLNALQAAEEQTESVSFHLALQVPRDEYPEYEAHSDEGVYIFIPTGTEFYQMCSFTLPADAVLCRAWIAENTPYGPYES